MDVLVIAAKKDHGNALFAKGRYQEAMACYSQAAMMAKASKHLFGSCDALEGNGNEEEKKAESANNGAYLEAVCLSNLSNCQFELGQYLEAIDTADQCLALLNEYSCDRGSNDDSEITAKVTSLVQKNLLRKARAQFHQKSFDDSMETLQKLMTSCDNNEKDPYYKRASKMIKQAAYYQHLQNDKVEGSPGKPVRLLRPAWMEPSGEYYKFGHDPCMSALENLESRDGSSINTKVKGLHLQDTAPQLSIFMAGINDGRHVMTTIMHIREQYEELLLHEESDDNTTSTAGKKIATKNLKALLVCNDINRASMARFVLVMVILSKIGRQAKTMAELKANNSQNDASKWCTVLQYVFLSYAMPEWCNEMLVKAMEEIKAFPSCPDFQKAYPWLPCSSESDWELIIPILSYWIHQASSPSSHDGVTECNDYGYPSDWKDLPCVKDSLDKCFEFVEEDAEAMMNSVPGKSMQQFKKKTEAASSSFKANALEQLKDINTYTPEMKQMLAQMFPGISSEQELMEKMVKMAEEIPEQELTDLTMGRKQHLMKPGILLAQAFAQGTKAILPPREYCNYPVFAKIYELDESTENDKPTKENGKHSQAAILKCCKAARDCIDKTWKTNPCMFDPLEFSFHPTPVSHRFSPISDFMDHFNFTDFCKEPIQIDSMTQRLVKKTAASSLSAAQFSDFTHCYFWNAARSLLILCENRVLTVEWNVRDVISVSQNFQAKADVQPKFHRILASNIPDYTGMLSFFTEVLPLLHEPTEEVTSSLGVNILLNPPLWDNYAHYIYSSTGIYGIRKVEDILGFKYLGDPDDDAWGHYYWTLAKKPIKMASKNELTVWLHQLFLLTVLPGERNANKTLLVESYPNTISLFIRVCEFCVQTLGYPRHWISCVLEELLASTAEKPMKTKAHIQRESPPRYQEPSSIHKIDISPFTMDLRTQLALHRLGRNNACLLPLESSLLMGPVNRYEIEIPVDLSPRCRGPHNGDCNSLALTILLEPKKPKSFTAIERMEMMSQWTQGNRRNRASIRKDIIANGSMSFHVLSCVEWGLVGFGRANFARFYMAESDFRIFHTYYLSILRTDGWFRLGDPIQLSKAKKLSP